MQERTEALEQEVQTRFRAFMETNSELNAFIADINLMLEGTEIELIGFLLNPVEAILDYPMPEEDEEFFDFEVLGK